MKNKDSDLYLLVVIIIVWRKEWQICNFAYSSLCEDVIMPTSILINIVYLGNLIL